MTISHLSVIIPAYNNIGDVSRCKTAVLHTTSPERTEVLIQDDASPDYNGVEVFGDVCQRNPVNLGFPGNCNAGALRARGEVLLFLNQDALPVSLGWDTLLLDFFDSTPDAGIAGPTLLFPNGQVQSVGGAFDGHCQPYHRALGFTNPDWSEINTPAQVSWVTGAALAIRRDLWVQLGGFDTVYGRGYFEDVDLCVRAATAGWHIHHRPNIRMIHAVGSTGGNPQMMDNALEFKRRWVDTKSIEPDTNDVREGWW